MFKDGSYDLCDVLKESPEFNPYKFELSQYFDSLGVKIEPEYKLTVQLTIDKNGQVKSVKLNDDKFRLTENDRKRYESVILKMPVWNRVALHDMYIAYKIFVTLR